MIKSKEARYVWKLAAIELLMVLLLLWSLPRSQTTPIQIIPLDVGYWFVSIFCIITLCAFIYGFQEEVGLRINGLKKHF